MTPAQTRVDAAVWSVPGHAPVIEYSKPVLRQILDHVVEAYDSFLSGGFEVGGVLFGRRSGDLVRILAARPLEISPPRPSFVLGKKDEQKLEELLGSAASDSELAGMEPVGWYHSHTRSEVFLSESDLEIFDAHFRHRWQIAMVLRPSASEAVRVGFFFRESDGFIRADQSYHEFAVDAPTKRSSQPQRPPWALTEEGEPVATSVAVEEPEPAKPPSREVEAPEPLVKRFQWRKLLAWGLAAVATVFALAMAYSVATMSSVEAPLGLEVTAQKGDLNIRWDSMNPAVGAAQAAILFIVDGQRRVDRPLDAVHLRRSNETFRHRSPRVDVRLRLNLSWGRTRQEIATYLAHPNLGEAPPELVALRKELVEAENEKNGVSAELRNWLENTEKLHTRIAELTRVREALLDDQKKRKAPRRFALSVPPKPGTRDLPTGPEIQLRNAASLQAQLPQNEVRIAPPAAPPPPLPAAVAPARPIVETPKPRPAVPTSGRFLWSGALPRNGVLTIEGKQASLGTVTGELPGGPVRIGAYPADLSGDMLRVFTPNPRFAAEPRLDPPSAGNGWNRTQYLYEPKAARDLIVEQMPGAAGPKRIVLRAGGRTLSVILIEWQVSTP